MKIIFVRHAEPDYEHDSLTEKGFREAELLADMLKDIEVDAYYCSPMGRAQATASFTLEKIGRSAKTLDWLHEFDGKINLGSENEAMCWDMLPREWTAEDGYYSADSWYKTGIMKTGNAEEEYRKVCRGIDELMAEHGYEHNGRVYKVTESNHKTLMLFCHFGVMCVILSHIFSCSPMVFWHNFAALPSSVTTIVSEEREEGIASFRCSAFGELSHLCVAGEEPSFAARFCECFSDDTRH